MKDGNEAKDKAVVMTAIEEQHHPDEPVDNLHLLAAAAETLNGCLPPAAEVARAQAGSAPEAETSRDLVEFGPDKDARTLDIFAGGYNGNMQKDCLTMKRVRAPNFALISLFLRVSCPVCHLSFSRRQFSISPSPCTAPP